MKTNNTPFSLLHLLHIVGRVIAFIINMNGEGKRSRVGELLYERGYSTGIAIYGVCWSLALIGWFMMLWSYDFILTFGDREGQERRIWAAHSRAGFDVLTLLVRNTPEPAYRRLVY